MKKLFAKIKEMVKEKSQAKLREKVKKKAKKKLKKFAVKLVCAVIICVGLVLVYEHRKPIMAAIVGKKLSNDKYPACGRICRLLKKR